MIGLGTLLGLDDRPGEVAGWGVVPASVARAIVAAQQRCEWRFGVHDDAGWLLFDGITRRRAMPAGADRCDDAATRVDGVVEIHLPSQWLTHAVDRRGLLEGVDPRWRALLADLAAQFAADRRIAQDPGARFPGRPLRRRTQTVFRWCIFPGCRRPALQCQIDHLKDSAKGGATVEENLAPGCAHDHSLKTERGWRLVRTGPRTYCWISPHGRRHHVDVPRLVLPAVTPLPGKLRAPVDDGEPPPF
ncbi:MAG: HNH endonuclease signature motif containing protein [Jatrophihabitans sp.]|uniref:HNH endonuclease signature motif containing protein n=1 Tax=Jatrophihabitans sp. TaxID=1932789 RepID=UPI003F7D1467